MVGRVRDARVHLLDLAYDGPCLARLLGRHQDLGSVIAVIDPADLREIGVVKAGVRYRLGAVEPFRAALTVYEPWRPPTPPPAECAPRRRRKAAPPEEQIDLPLPDPGT
jgi:hypothetical protein